MARILAGAWRTSPPPLDLSRAALVAAAPLLLASGAAGLAWWRLRGSLLAEAAEEAGLRQAYRLHTLEAAVHRHRIVEAFRAFQAGGLDPVLVKGWAIARHYPEEGLRPYTDLDLYVRTEDAAAAAATALDLAGRGCPVDLHRGWGRLDDRAAGVLLGGSARVGLEDLLRGELRRNEWVACALALAHVLLGASLEGAPARVRERRLPRWLVPTVLRAWGSLSPATPQGSRRPMSDYSWRPAGWLHALRVRWPNPIEATIGVGGPFNEIPRLPFQIGECLSRAARFAGETRARRRALTR